MEQQLKEMIKEAHHFVAIHDNIVIKFPNTPVGLKAVHLCAEEGIHTNVTVTFSANQALLAAKAGATYVSPFIGRLDDISEDGMELIQEIRTIFDNYGYTTKILAASIRHPLHVLGDRIQEHHDDALSTHRGGAGRHLTLPIDGQDRLDVQQGSEERLAPADPARRQEAVECLDGEHDARLIPDSIQLPDNLIGGDGHLRQLCGLQHQQPLKKGNSTRVHEMDR